MTRWNKKHKAFAHHNIAYLVYLSQSKNDVGWSEALQNFISKDKVKSRIRNLHSARNYMGEVKEIGGKNTNQL